MLRRRFTQMLPIALAAVVLTGCDKQTVTTTQVSLSPRILAAFDFDKVEAGGLPAGFVAKQNNPTTELASWKAAADGAAPSPPNVLAVQTANDNATFNLLMAEGTSFADLDIRVKVRGNSGTHDQGGGLIWRAKDENNYYVCRMNPLETNFRVYKVVDGKRKQLQSAEGIKTETGKWYEVRITMAGDRILCYLDNERLLDVQDTEFAEAGMIGLWTKADASSSFDELVVTQPPEAAPSTRPE